jgi:hypothetical protein
MPKWRTSLTGQDGCAVVVGRTDRIITSWMMVGAIRLPTTRSACGCILDGRGTQAGDGTRAPMRGLAVARALWDVARVQAELGHALSGSLGSGVLARLWLSGKVVFSSGGFSFRAGVRAGGLGGTKIGCFVCT